MEDYDTDIPQVKSEPLLIGAPRLARILWKTKLRNSKKIWHSYCDSKLVLDGSLGKDYSHKTVSVTCVIKRVILERIAQNSISWI